MYLPMIDFMKFGTVSDSRVECENTYANTTDAEPMVSDDDVRKKTRSQRMKKKFSETESKLGIISKVMVNSLFFVAGCKDATSTKSGLHEFGQKVELLSFPTVVSDCKSDHY